MSTYFNAFPKIYYNNVLVTDISKRVQLPKSLEDDPYLFLPYTVQHDDKPETVAYHYYGSVEYTWLVYFANGIIDPYTDWVMDTNTFNNYLMKKYEKASGMVGYDVIHWTQNQNNPENILYYRNVLDDSVRINKDTVLLDPSIRSDEWLPVRIYQEEFEKNEEKRVVRLVNKEYKSVLKTNLHKALDQ